MIYGGYYIKARSTMNSEIMHFPPYVREVWDWLLMNANHTDGKSSGTTIKRGQLFTSLDDISEGLCWYIGYRKVRYTKDQMKKAMKSLKKASMITTNKSTRGFVITICNYSTYQNQKNYESTSDSTDESSNKAPSKLRGNPTINKNSKKNKNENIFLPDWIPEEDWNDYLAMRIKIKKPATDRAQKMAITELDKLRTQDNDPAKVLQQSIFKNYPGLYPINNSQTQNTSGSAGIC